MSEDYVTLWACQDCLMVAAGYSEDELGSVPEFAPLTRLPENGMGDLVIGLTADEHSDDCPAFQGGDFIGDVECDCETLSFSWRHCDSCDSHLGGSRHALTYFPREVGNV